MSCIVLQDSEGAHLGFILCSPDLKAESGDCLFMAFPGQPFSFATPESAALARRREVGESAWQVNRRDPLTVVVHTPGLPDEMFIEFEHSDSGRWGIGGGFDREVLGIAMPAKPRVCDGK